MKLFDPEVIAPDYKKLRVYAAGALFSEPELLGNEWLAWGLEQVAGEKVEIILPQRNRFPQKDDLGFRCEDILQVLCTDALIISANGIDVDSGSVKEKEIAGAIDHPVVMYRSDFRRGGDSLIPPGPDLRDYNLMLSGGARLTEVQWNGMIAYRQIVESNNAEDVTAVSKAVAIYAAEQVLAGLRAAVLSEPTTAGSSAVSLRVLYQQQIDQHRGLSAYIETRLGLRIDEFLDRVVERQLEVNSSVRKILEPGVPHLLVGEITRSP